MHEDLIDDALKGQFPPNRIAPLEVLVGAPAGSRQVRAVVAQIARLPDVSAIAPARAAGIDQALLAVAPVQPPLSDATQRLVRDVRALHAPVYLGEAGQTASHVDLEHSLGNHLPAVLAVIVASQIKQRIAGEPIKDRVVSLADPDARPIRKGKLGKPNEFGYVNQLAEVTEHTRRGARGLILPAATGLGNPGEDMLLPQNVAELKRLGISPREVALDGGFNVGPTRRVLEDLAPERVFIAGRQQPGSRRTQRRLQRYRTGAEGRISHLKRRYGMDRSRLKGDEGQQIWNGWAILAYNADTLAVRTR